MTTPTPTMTTVRRVEAGDALFASRVLARAFADYPMTRFLLPEDDYQRRLELLHEVFVVDVFELREVWASPGTTSVAVWQPPDRELSGDGLDSVLGRLADVFGDRAELAIGAEQTWRAHHPGGPFWYLHLLGTHPDWQRRGLGRAVCEPVLEHLDSIGADAVLDTGAATNLALYRSMGFEVIGEWDMPGGGPHGWTMHRPARRP
jgi:ribosomal protein S18 acetylase RimI-like enzyme